jgi:hypothetical protein
LQENLSGVGVKLAETKYQLRHVRSFDPQREHLAGEDVEKANAFLSRSYRKPFVIPEKI